MNFEITRDQYQRLLKAKELGKYGHLETWKELYVFQRTLAMPDQLQEVAAYAKRNNKGEKIRLPLTIQKQIDIKQERLNLSK